MKFSLPEFSLSKPVTVTMIVISFVTLGAISLSRLKVEFLPKIEFPFLGVFIAYPGATPAQVEQEIAIPAEGEFRTLPNLERMMTNSDDGGCFVQCLFKMGADMSEAQADVRDRIERVRLELPPEANRIFIRHFSSDDFPVMEFGLAREGDAYEYGHLVREVLQPRLARLPGVAEIEVWGGDIESILIEFHQDTLRNYGLSIFQVIGQLQTANLNVSVGKLVDGKTKYFVRALDEFQRPEDIAQLMIGNGLRLKDVADVGYKRREDEDEWTMDGLSQLYLVVHKESEANIVATVEAVLAELDEVLALPEFEGTKKIIFFSQADAILGALGGLTSAAWAGGGLSILILYVFLIRIKPTFIVSLSLPGSMMAAVIFMYFMDMSLNLVTMMSLVIALGMVVDNSIVVVENIYRLRSLGYGTIEASKRGTNEMALAITAATATSIVVFLPVFFVDKGQLNTFLRQFATPVSVAMAASLVIALTAIPLAIGKTADLNLRGIWRVLRGRRVDAADKTDTWTPETGFNPTRWMIPFYAACLRATMRWRLASTLLLAGIVWLTIEYPVKNLGRQGMPTADERRIGIQVEFDPNFDMAKADEYMGHLEEEVGKYRETLGIKNVFKHVNSRWSELDVFLYDKEDDVPPEKLKYTSDDAMNILWERFGERLPGARLRFRTGMNSLGGAGGQASVSLRLRGDDAETLDRYADQLVTVMQTLPNVTEVEKNVRPPEQEIRIDVDETLADSAGINATMIAQTVGFALMGARLPGMKEGDREVPIWAQFREEDRKSRANLDNVMLLGTEGRLVPLNRLVNFGKANTPQSITRMEGKNYITLSAKTDGGDLKQINEDLRTLQREFELPTGYSISLGDELMSFEKDAVQFMTAMVMSIVLIYIVMSALFESLLLPLSILTSVPLAFVGVYWLMYVTSTPMDTVAFIGCILMIGVVVNNGIVIVDRINNLRNEGMDRFDAIIQAGRDRLRPVLMTALTTILGAVPLAIGAGGMGGASIVSLGRAMIGGMITGTFLTLLITPLTYSFIDDVQVWVLRYLGNMSALMRRSSKA